METMTFMGDGGSWFICLYPSRTFRNGLPAVSGGMKVVELWRFEIPFSSGGFSSNTSP